MVKHDTILEQLVHLRTGKALDERLKGNKCRCYQDALKQQDFAFAKLERVKWSREQQRIIDDAISANSNCGAVYGAVAYRLGLEDGVRLMRELDGIR